MTRVNRGPVAISSYETTPGRGWWQFRNAAGQLVWEAPYSPLGPIGNTRQQWADVARYVELLGYAVIEEAL